MSCDCLACQAFPDDLDTKGLHPCRTGKRKFSLRAFALTRQHFITPTLFRYVSKRFRATVAVPAGFITDFGSVPGWAKWFLDGDSKELLYGSLPHDLLYALRGILPSGEKRRWTRLEADWLLLEAMLAAGSSRLKAYVAFIAVRLGGWLHWR